MPYQNTTLAQLQVLLAQRYDGQPFWTADQARRALNEGLRIYNLITGARRAAIALNTIPNDPYLAVVGTLVKGTRVSMNGRVLAPCSLFGLDHGLHNWESTTTATPGAPPAPAYWAPVGLTEIAIYPADAAGPRAIVVDGVISTALLVNPGDFVDLGDEEVGALLGYALHALSFAKGIEALTRSRPGMVALFKAAAKKNAVFAASSFYRKIIGVDRTRYQQPIEAPVDPAAQQVIGSLAGGGGS